MRRTCESSSERLVIDMFKCFGLIPYNISIIELRCLEKLFKKFTNSLSQPFIYGVVWIDIDYEDSKYSLASSFKIVDSRSELMDSLRDDKRYVNLIDKVTLVKNSNMGRYVRDVGEKCFREISKHVDLTEPTCYDSREGGKICFTPINLGAYSFTNLSLNIKCLDQYRVEFSSPSFFTNLAYKSGESIINTLVKISRGKASKNLVNEFLNLFYETLLDELRKGGLSVKGLHEDIVYSIITELRR